ncbi:MAG: ThuA domain-containing protein [Limisphaerales bacterium]
MNNLPVSRRKMLRNSAVAALGLSLTSCMQLRDSAAGRPKRVLFFTKSSGYEHSAIKRNGGKPSFAEQVLAELGPKHNLEFTFSKDGSLFTPKYLDQFDAFFFYTTGDLTTEGTDKNPPMTAEGKQAFIDAVKHGKGFIGTHSGADTFHTRPDPADKSTRYQTNGDKSDPYVLMLGGEFIKHGPQQVAKMRVVDSKFPGLENVEASFAFQEEWYSLKEFQPNLHVLLVQETEGMKGEEYQRGPYPATWARTCGKGRVFYTSMGHREDVWMNEVFQKILLGGINWAVRNVNADVTPNLEQAAPKCHELPPKPAPVAPKKKA